GLVTDGHTPKRFPAGSTMPFFLLSIPRSGNSCDVLHPVSLPGLALVWRSRLLPVARCRSDVGPDEARPNSLSLDRIIPIESAHAIVEAPNHGRIQWFGWCPAVEPPD